MRSIAVSCLAALAGLSPLAAEPLSEADRQVLLDRLDQLRDQAGDYVSQRLASAARDFRSASASAGAAVDLYIDCVEKVEFEQQDRSGSEFRDWKSQNRDRFREEGFGLALQYQLRWALLTIQAANRPEQIAELVPQATQLLEAIYQDPATLKAHVDMLSRPVTSTVFAKAYGLNGYQPEDWPLAPLQGGGGKSSPAQVFETLIFPELRARRDAAALRRAWQQRIRFEELARGYWSEDSTDQGQSPELDEFIAEGRPVLRWEMEEDLFRLGDQKQAALGMLKLLSENLSSRSARDWEARFRELVASSRTPVEKQPDSLDIDS